MHVCCNDYKNKEFPRQRIELLNIPVTSCTLIHLTSNEYLQAHRFTEVCLCSSQRIARLLTEKAFRIMRQASYRTLLCILTFY